MKTIQKSAGLRGAGMVLALILSAYMGATFFGHSGAAQEAAPAPNNDYLIGSVLYMQTAAEYRALAYQAYNLARQRFDYDLKTKGRSRKKPRAVVVDADETVIDNSRYEASVVLKHKIFNADDFTGWCKQEAATAIPGAVEFLNYAHSKGARIFYVTNRSESAERECTGNNLKKLGFPDVSDETLLLKEKISSKEPRRLLIAKRHRIVLFIGDNLNDLAKVFEGKFIAERSAAVDSLKGELGTRFIVLPNAMYGEWENAVYEYKSLDPKDKAAKRLSTLNGF